ncbi:MAG: hypothetical protein IPM74_06800 [Crocinitomicaceae bacterium]|nr:hypothetical protein [Crocinitomicaceae bacterium]MBK8925607.1 hypothetical protein [Crocinitomicaceae bacterium]
MKINLLIIPVITYLLVACAGTNESTSTSTTSVEADTTTEKISGYPDFELYIASLETTVENTDSAFAKYEILKENFSQDEKDSAFFLIRQFYHKFEISEEEMGDYSEKTQKEIEKKYGKYGFEVWWEEGYAFPMPDLKYIRKKMKQDISEPLTDYIDLLIDVDGQITGDAALAISWDELAKQILTCEDFIVDHQGNILYEKYYQHALSLYAERLNFLKWGLDNTPVVNMWSDTEVKQLDSEVEKAYQKVINDKKHKTSQIIQEHLDFLVSIQFENVWDHAEYVEADDIEELLEIK